MRILIAEDERDLNRLIVKTLEKAGYGVDACFDGEEAQYFLEHTDYDAAILDIMMPKKDGLAVLKSVRQRGSDLPILFLTARDSIADRVQGLDAGADDYLVKPFDFDELHAPRLQRDHHWRPDPGHQDPRSRPERESHRAVGPGVRHPGIPVHEPRHRPFPGEDRGPYLEL